MYLLNYLLADTGYRVVSGRDGIEISDVVCDNRQVDELCLFICIKGANFDGHDAIAEAIEAGAAAVLAQDAQKLEMCREAAEKKNVTLLLCGDTRYAAAYAACAACGHPADRLFKIGVTGTKGKSTTVSLIRAGLEAAGIKTGLVGTIEIYDGEQAIPSANTTPDAFMLQEAFMRMADNGCRAVVMEVSSQGLMMHRTAGFVFDVGIFTNLSPDHIGPNEHKDFDDYLACKKLLFKQSRMAFYNADDRYAASVMEGNTCDLVFGYGGGDEDISFGDISLINREGRLGVGFELKTKNILSSTKRRNVEFMQPGRFSAYNVTAAYCGALAAVISLNSYGDEAADRLFEGFNRAWVKGRIEMLPVSDKYTLMIDYAHNAMALESLLTTIREYEHGRIVTLFGCGGNRAKSRRYEMGEVSGRLSDLTVITSDNPRNEEPMDIIADIVSGIKKTSGEYVTIADRKEAIGYCIEHALQGDIVILAGKGHEDYQEIKGEKHHMDERELVMQLLKEMGDEAGYARMKEAYPDLKA